MKRMLVTLVLSSVAAGASPHDHEGCPMSGATARHAEVDKRHQHVAGVSGAKGVHHFLLAGDGGSIRIEAGDAADIEARDRIRRHLRQVAESFAAGDFSMPMRIHGQVPPGVEVMKEMKAAIRYEFSPSERGGAVRISTSDAEALAAVHAFLRFQIEDHGTGDPVEAAIP